MLLRNAEGSVLISTSIMQDEERAQIDRVYEAFGVNRTVWMTLEDLRNLTGIPSPGSIASRIRDLRAEGTTIIKRVNRDLSHGRSRVYEYSYTI
jgi:hypothetical protein